MADHYGPFPFAEIRTGTEDYFSTWEAVQRAGYDDNQIWSVVESEGSYSYGPPHHIVNLVGYIATKERHDFQTYYHDEEKPEDEDLSLLLDNALESFEKIPSNETAGNLLQALLDAENEGVISDEEFRDELVSIVSWLKDPTPTDIKGVT